MPNHHPRNDKLDRAIRPVVEQLEGRTYLSTEGQYDYKLSVYDHGTE